jgi:hypothetical protein
MLAQKLGNKRTAFLRLALWCLGNMIVESPSCAVDLVEASVSVTLILILIVT